MKIDRRAYALLVPLLVGAVGVATQEPEAPPPLEEELKELELVERGEYLVHRVAMCIYCHTPKREENGALIEERLLQGARFPLESPYPELEFAFQAPKIAGLPGGWTAYDMVRFLQTFKTPSGGVPGPPMPPFKMEEADAKAVTAYLLSLAE